MNRFIPLLVVFLFPVIVLSQRDTANWDRTMDGVHKRSLCLVDTVVAVHTAKRLVIEDSTEWTYSFAEGDRTYLEIKIRTTVCSCMDCSSADHILIDITGLKPNEELEISPSNSVWIIWNSLMIGMSESSFSGVLNYKDSGDFSFEVFKYVPGQSWLTYDGIRVERQHQ